MHSAQSSTYSSSSSNNNNNYGRTRSFNHKNSASSNIISQINRIHSNSSHNRTRNTDNTTTNSATNNNHTTIIIAYAVTVTDCQPDSLLLDNAAILKHSIHLATRRRAKVPSSSSPSSSFTFQYDYQMYAFVYAKSAQNCTNSLQQLGYTVQVHELPIVISDIQNPQLRQAIYEHGCCGPQELLKLYSYLLVDHPLVVHLDLDCIVLQPLDHLFNWMLGVPLMSSRSITEFTEQQQQQQQQAKTTISTIETVLIAKARMWPLVPPAGDNNQSSRSLSSSSPPPPDALFTRDYNVVDPPRKQPHQIGVQGGFFIVRPNITDFQHYQEILYQRGPYTNSFDVRHGWGGKALGFGGYWGYTTIQGLMAYYYSHVQPPSRSVELNRCYYNTMVDDPYNTHAANRGPPENQPLACRTRQEPISACQDCRLTPVDQMYTVHFTLCGKPTWCPTPLQAWPVLDQSPSAHQVCMELHRIWHTIRWDLEQGWMELYRDDTIDYDQYNLTRKIEDKDTKTTRLETILLTSSVPRKHGYQPHLANFSEPKLKKFPDNVMYYLENYFMNHCRKPFKKGYKKLRFPHPFYNPTEGATPLLWK
jgi:hypothetical protein